MKKKLVLIFSILLFVVGCNSNDNGPTGNKIELPDGISGYTSFKYEYLGTAPIHTQTSMLSGFQNRLYRFGDYSPVQVLDLSTKTWSQIQLPDSSFWRWDGAAVTINDSIYVVATSTNISYDILKLNVQTSSLQHTNVNLPKFFHYPAYCKNGDKIIFLSLGTDSVYEYNSTINKLKKVVENPFYNSVDNNLTLSSGKYSDYLYVFGGFSDMPSNLFYRLDLNNYNWEKLNIPPSLEKMHLFGSTFGNHFVLFKDSISTFDYSFLDNKWYEDTTKVPIYARNLIGQFGFTEWSFFSTDSVLYGTDIFSNKVWKIKK